MGGEDLIFTILLFHQNFVPLKFCFIEIYECALPSNKIKWKHEREREHNIKTGETLYCPAAIIKNKH